MGTTTTDVGSPESVFITESDDSNDFESSELTGNDFTSTRSTSAASSKRRHGRSTSDIWTLFTDAERPHQLKEVVCKHCKIKVRHHKKSELARQHLLRCSKFRQKTSERNFSTFGFVHSKLRNQLSTETVKKLVFVKSNVNQLDGTLTSLCFDEIENEIEEI